MTTMSEVEAAASALATALLGRWESTDAFGNTALDWSQSLKEKKATLTVAFRENGSFSFAISAVTANGEKTNITKTFKHVVAEEGTFETKGCQLLIAGDRSGIRWSFQLEEDEQLRIKLEGAKRFGRCQGVDVIYFKRVEATE
ncbi:TPA: hypothetical protein N0F65_010910 [Lagenidium giganteum]|uniref:DUF1579 domain-containing protein n=1 Tax=Lagenidium giganteum TaxID=4803 RepID=A0AAV2YZZ4_9STRA|nr:TPA: hypothetical protein N0F65_010910 [Lagenidium giganteum]